VLLLGLAPSARAYVNTGYSLEWLCAFSPVVVRAQVSEVTGKTVECVPAEAFKGKAEKPIRFEIRGDLAPGVKGTNYLIFLARTEDGLAVTHWINLDRPNAEKGEGMAFNKSGDVLTDGGSIIKLVKQRLKGKALRHSPSGRVTGTAAALSIPAPGKAEMALWQGSSTYLLVPPDPEFKKVFLARYQASLKGRKDFHQDLSAAWDLMALSYYPDREVIELCKKALKDDSHKKFDLPPDSKSGFPGASVRVYPLRQSAYEALTAMGQKVDRPEYFCEYFFRGGGSWGFRDPKTKQIIQF
jgi:hypothetical protein